MDLRKPVRRYSITVSLAGVPSFNFVCLLVIILILIILGIGGGILFFYGATTVSGDEFWDLYSSGLKQDKQKKQYQTSVINKGDIAHRVNCKIIIGKGGKVKDKLFFEKIPKSRMRIILNHIEEDRFIKQPIRINFSYYDKVGNHIYSRWFKDKGKKDFIAILSGQDQ